MTEKEVLSQFGHEFIKNTRDRTLKSYAKLKNNEMKSKNNLILYNKIKNLNLNEQLILDDVVYEIVDLVLFNVLNFFSVHDKNR